MAPRGQDVDPELVCPGFVIQGLYLYLVVSSQMGDILMKCRMSELVWELSVVRVTGSDPRTRRQAETRGSSSG